MQRKIIRYKTLKARGIVESHAQLHNMQERDGFPLGMMLSPNVRGYWEDEVDAWLESRPTENTSPRKGAIKSKLEAKAAREREGADAT